MVDGCCVPELVYNDNGVSKCCKTGEVTDAKSRCCDTASIVKDTCCDATDKEITDAGEVCCEVS